MTTAHAVARSLNADVEACAFAAGLDDGGVMVDWMFVANLLQRRRDAKAAAAYGAGLGLGEFLRWAVPS